MRLIDADVEIEKLEKRKREYEEQLVICGIGQRDMIENVLFDIRQKIELLKQCPTAYDVDKVVG